MFKSIVQLEHGVGLVLVTFKTFVRSLMVDYIKTLENRNDELQSALTKSLTTNVELTDKLNSQLFFTYGVTASVNTQLIKIELCHHFFHSLLSACQFLNKSWASHKEDFKERYEIEPYNFKFKHFFIESYNNTSVQKNIRQVLEYDLGFENHSELRKFIQSIK